jgi:hypothetical protein
MPNKAFVLPPSLIGKNESKNSVDWAFNFKFQREGPVQNFSAMFFYQTFDATCLRKSSMHWNFIWNLNVKVQCKSSMHWTFRHKVQCKSSMQNFNALNFYTKSSMQKFNALNFWAKVQRKSSMHWTFGQKFNAKVQCIELLGKSSMQKFNALKFCNELLYQKFNAKFNALNFFTKSSMQKFNALNFRAEVLHWSFGSKVHCIAFFLRWNPRSKYVFCLKCWVRVNFCEVSLVKSWNLEGVRWTSHQVV